MMKIIVCGGREFDDWPLLESSLVEITGYIGFAQPLVIIEGGAKGADFLARVWAKCYGAGHREYKADWKKYGKAAGPIRNQRMLDEEKPDLVVAFPGGDGTADMVFRAKNAGVKVIEVQE